MNKLALRNLLIDEADLFIEQNSLADRMLYIAGSFIAGLLAGFGYRDFSEQQAELMLAQLTDYLQAQQFMIKADLIICLWDRAEAYIGEQTDATKIGWLRGMASAFISALELTLCEDGLFDADCYTEAMLACFNSISH